MRGSLAVWCEPDGRTVDGHEPKLELHFNIWRDLPGGIPDVLDVGFLFENPRTLNRAFLYVPARVELKDLEDLSPVLEDPKTLSAVFNNTLSVGRRTANCFEAVKGRKIAFHVIRVDFRSGANVSIESVPEDDGLVGTIITLEPTLIHKMEQVGSHYVRFRITLNGHLSSVFMSDVASSDRVFLSTFYKTELIEFRVNEKRNFGPELARRQNLSAPTIISAIHYFLVRKLDVEMAQSHTPFRKMRRLEPGLWNNYLQPLGGPDPQNMIIYHWRVPVEKGMVPVEDFIALTLFRRPKLNLITYIVAIVLLGAIGSSLQALLTSLLPIENHSQNTVAIQLSIITVLSLVLYFVYEFVSRRPRTSQSGQLCLRKFALGTWQRITCVIQRCCR